MPAHAPPPSVLSAFGVFGTPTLLAGGRGSSWRVGDAVLKTLDLGEEERQWQAHVLASIRCEGFRVAQPWRARDGSLEVIAVGEAFHAALAGVPRPGFIARRADPWAIGDRVAWGELPVAGFAHVKHLARLVSALRPIAAPSRLVHGDLTGNVLFDDRMPPAVIDFSPYWRPTGFASAVVVADALVWEGAQVDVSMPSATSRTSTSTCCGR